MPETGVSKLLAIVVEQCQMAACQSTMLTVYLEFEREVLAVKRLFFDICDRLDLGHARWEDIDIRLRAIEDAITGCHYLLLTRGAVAVSQRSVSENTSETNQNCKKPAMSSPAYSSCFVTSVNTLLAPPRVSLGVEPELWL